MLINHYKNMVVLGAKSAEDINRQIAEFGVPIELIALYSSGARFYAHVLPGQKIKMVKKKKIVKKKSIKDIQDKLNKE